MPTYVDVKPEILRWAVDRSGKSLEDFAPRVADWLASDKKPTFKQLQAFAKKAMVPFGYLFLKEPPDEPLPIPDFRMRKGAGVRRPSPNLLDTLYEMQRRQEWMREYLIEVGHDPLPFVGSATMGDDVVEVAQRMRRTLNLEDGWTDGESTWEAALRTFRHKVEDAGVLIFVNGIVANNTSRKLDTEEFQGFVLIDRVAPLIFVNGSDFKSARMFTIAHELAHVWIGQNALFELDALQPCDAAAETYCNEIAAELLVPKNEFGDAWSLAPPGERAFSEIARRFKVSPIVAARRAKDMQYISPDDFYSFYRRYMRREIEAQREQRGGGDFLRNQNARLGRRYGPAVVAALREGRLAYTQAYDLTQLRGATFDKYAASFR